MFSTLKSSLKNLVQPMPQAARAELERDTRQGPARTDPGCWPTIRAGLDWLCLAQDRSASADGGVARDYSLVKGWASSYPETTGYIIPTFIDMAQRLGRPDLHARARRMLDWCVAIQFPQGGFQGGKIDATPRVPVTFNTGQILLGLAAGVCAYGDAYRDAMLRAAGWLRDTQDPDGCWRRFPTPFAAPGEKAYETHVSWGLFEAERVAPGNGFGAAGLRQVDWALTKQRANGWFGSNCLTDPEAPLTHTIGYALRGVVEAWRLASGSGAAGSLEAPGEAQALPLREDLLAAARRTADSLVHCVGADGRLPGQLDADFRPAADYVCLTGSVQIAHSLILLHRATGDRDYLATARRLNAYVRRTVRLDGPVEQRGAVKGSFPVDGDYGRWEYLNWAVKFCLDSNLAEAELDGLAPA